MAGGLPLVSCIMPTFNRRPFITLALQGFLRQSYANKELLIVDDGTDPVGRIVAGLPGVRYLRLPSRTTIGAKRNLACDQAHGEIIAHWDDDDWYSPDRLTYQVEPIAGDAADVTGLANECIMTLGDGTFWTTSRDVHARMFVHDVHGGTLVYRRRLFENGLRYPEVNLAEDAALLRDAVAQGWRLQRLRNPGVFVYVRHTLNAWQFDAGRFIDPSGWQRREPPDTLPSDVLTCYRHAAIEPERPRGPDDDDGEVTWVDSLHCTEATASGGCIGWHGELGVDGRIVRVDSHTYVHALSVSSASRVAFRLDGRFTRLVTRAAVSDGTPADGRLVDFAVILDGRVTAMAAHVSPGDPPQRLEVDVTGATELVLLTLSSDGHACAAVWVDPFVDGRTAAATPIVHDCLQQVDIHQPAQRPRARHCIATVVSPAFNGLVDDMLGSLVANGCCGDATIVVLAVDADEDCVRLASKYGARLVLCRSRGRVSLAIKSALLALPQIMDADRFVFLDADMLILGDLWPLFATLDALPDGSVLACREGNNPGLTLEQALLRLYGGANGDIERLLQRPASTERAYPLIINTGLMAGSAAAFNALRQTIQGWPAAADWVHERPEIWWRDQFVFNLAVAVHACGVELDGVYNVQLHVHDAEVTSNGDRLAAAALGRDVKVLHFSGTGRDKLPSWRNLFARVQDPLPAGTDRDDYAAFLASLRRWVGRRGLSSLIWSFYGTPSGYGGRVRDRTMLPLLATLHYLVRANGCTRVLETGTARGVSAACLASAVFRRNGRVVTFDREYHDGRNELWHLLPPAMSAAIEARTGDAIDGMTAALAGGERFHAALLDSDHSADHVYREFLLATKLVCPGGLILVHDAVFAGGEVPLALAMIAQSGYGVVRLWTPSDGVCEDNGLGLAVIENARRDHSGQRL